MDEPVASADSGLRAATVEPPTFSARLQRILFGPPRDLGDRHLFHRLSVVAFLAWVGLGADGLSSSVYGPEETFRTLGAHTYLAVALAGAMVLTVLVISIAYSRVIEHFPTGGGGYVVASALLGARAGVVSGSALLVDYVLTIAISIAAAGDALFSLLPPVWHGLKLPTEVMLVLALTIINIRGVKESILLLLPIFLLFLATHVVLIGGGLLAHAPQLPATVREVGIGFRDGYTSLGCGGLLLLFARAYSLGGGTYTGIEAVSNGLPIMREPRVRTGKRTMLYMAISLACTAAGLIVCYLLWQVRFAEGKTLNAVLAERFSHDLGLGRTFVILTLVSEGALLVVAAQAGFIDGPRVLANMALDWWVPRRFASLSERLTTRNGIVLMGTAALATLFYAQGDVRRIVVMYSINVFLTFSITELSMCRLWWRDRRQRPDWTRKIRIHAVGLTMCVTILVVTVCEKFREGGWLTLAITGGVVALCFLVHRHYRALQSQLAALFGTVAQMRAETAPAPPRPLDPALPTAAVLVGGYSSLGIHTLLAALRNFPGQFQNVVFLSVGVLDSGVFKGEHTLVGLREQTQQALRQYVELAAGQGLAATSRFTLGTDLIAELERLCLETARDFPHTIFFAGQLAFHRRKWYQSFLHNQTAFALQERLHRQGHTLVILPARI
ncbi:MAG: APC family permease [Planctomycetes bacterium]|jgi:amino acid transporter|nr:APC family permease [Planctomycetota bacterium]